MALKKGPLLYEGKGKKVYAVADVDDLLWMEFKDSLTAFNAQKIGSFLNKGAIGRDIASAIFSFLQDSGIKSHWVANVGAHEMICKKLAMIPLEVVVRNVIAGSFAKKFGLEEGGTLPQPIVEFYYKNDELADPFISDEQALYLKAVTDQKSLDLLKAEGRLVNDRLRTFFASADIQLVDFKLEFGWSADGSLILGDEITPDSCRLWDLKTGEKLDKDRFRRDLGGVAEGYAEVLRRISR